MPDVEVYLLQGLKRTDVTPPSSWSTYSDYKKSCVVAKVDPSLPVEIRYYAATNLASGGDGAVYADVEYRNFASATCRGVLTGMSGKFTSSSVNFTLSPEKDLYFIDVRYDYKQENYVRAYTAPSEHLTERSCSAN